MTPRCTRCAGNKIWVIPAREPGIAGGVVDVCIASESRGGAFYTHGAFLLHACAQCGNTEWYAIQCDDYLRNTLCTDGSQCLLCGGVMHAATPSALRPTTRMWSGFGFRICADCGHTPWSVDATYTFQERRSALETCSCGRLLEQIEPVRAQGIWGDDVLPVLLRKGRWLHRRVGHFALDFCGACSNAHWYARGLERLHVDEVEGVRLLVSRGEYPGGPYRSMSDERTTKK